MLRLAKVGSDDIVLDLGSGWGQTLIIALSEFGVKRAVGVERVRARYETSKARLGRWSKQRPDLAGRWDLFNTNFDRVLKNEEKRFNPSDASVIYYGLETDSWILNKIARAWKGMGGRRRLVYYYNCLFPEIMPNAVDHPFFVSVFPFTPPSSVKAWLMAMTGKTASSMTEGIDPDENELWDELRHDYRVASSAQVQDTIVDYKRRLRRAAKASRKGKNLADCSPAHSSTSLRPPHLTERPN
jgi:hypothetical protein